MRRLSLIFVLCGGCGLGLFDDAGGGNRNLPTLGAGPYAKPELDFDTLADEPYVLDADAQLRDPAVLHRDDGGFRIWLGREPDNQPQQSEIWYAELASIHDLAERGPEQILVPDQAWEETRVAAPAVVDAGDRLVMYYEGGVTARAIGRAESTDGGFIWTKDAGPVLEGATEPTAARLPDGSWVLFVTRTDQPGIFRADSADGVNFTVADLPAVAARPDQATAFDRYAVSDPFLIVRETAAGQLHWGLFFNGLARNDDVAIGFAGSFDGLAWERFGGPDPVLHPGAPVENGPAVVLEPARGYLFFDERSQSRQKITVAVHP